jgi:signal peptidase II
LTDKSEKPGKPVPKKKLNRYTLFAIIALVSLVLDQATKIWARETLPVGRSMSGPVDPSCQIPEDVVAHKCVGINDTVIENYWDWRLSFNPGSAFGLFNSASGARVFLSIVGVLAVFGMLWMLWKAREDQKWLIWALGLVAGGAVGNLIDRIYYGVVTDFILWHYHSKEWPVFNIADVALVIGVGLMFLDIGGESKKDKREKAKKRQEKIRAARIAAREKELAEQAKAGKSAEKDDAPETPTTEDREPADKKEETAASAES